VERLISLANLTNILSGFYCEPDTEFLRNEEVKQIFLKDSLAIDNELFDYAKNIVESIKKYSDLEILQEFTKIFIGPYEVLAHPYASVYLDGYTLNGESTQKILHYYNHCGLLFDEEIKDLPDNIVIMLQFLHYLLNSEINGGDIMPNINWSEKRKEFIDLYLRTWIPEFTERIINGTQNEFYKNLGKYTNKFFHII